MNRFFYISIVTLVSVSSVVFGALDKTMSAHLSLTNAELFEKVQHATGKEQNSLIDELAWRINNPRAVKEKRRQAAEQQRQQEEEQRLKNAQKMKDILLRQIHYKIQSLYNDIDMEKQDIYQKEQFEFDEIQNKKYFELNPDKLFEHLQNRFAIGNLSFEQIENIEEPEKARFFYSLLEDTSKYFIKYANFPDSKISIVQVNESPFMDLLANVFMNKRFKYGKVSKDGRFGIMRFMFPLRSIGSQVDSIPSSSYDHIKLAHRRLNFKKPINAYNVQVNMVKIPSTNNLLIEYIWDNVQLKTPPLPILPTYNDDLDI